MSDERYSPLGAKIAKILCPTETKPDEKPDRRHEHVAVPGVWFSRRTLILLFFALVAVLVGFGWWQYRLVQIQQAAEDARALQKYYDDLDRDNRQRLDDLDRENRQRWREMDREHRQRIDLIIWGR